MKLLKSVTLPPSFVLYPLSFLLIIGWWSLAFKQEASSPENPFLLTSSNIKAAQAPSPLEFLSPLDRDVLKRALSGDVELMSKMIADWDVDALILESKGYADVKRLPRNDYLRGQVLVRQLKRANSEQNDALRAEKRLRTIQDDNGVSFDLYQDFHRFLPQTVVSASFLLALTSPDQIVAIPRRLNDFSSLVGTLDHFPVQFERYDGEFVYHQMPDVAFVAHYSHPSTIQALKNQGVKIFTMHPLASFEEITGTLERIGQVINRPLEAELMKTFMNAAMLAIDNRLMAMRPNMTNGDSPLKVLCVNYHTHFTVPTTRTVSGYLLQRLSDYTPLLAKGYVEAQSVWGHLLDQEQLLQLNPDCMIISTSNQDEVIHQLNGCPAYQSLSAYQQRRIAFVDECIQEFPSQYIVIAYYDLYLALAQVQTP